MCVVVRPSINIFKLCRDTAGAEAGAEAPVEVSGKGEFIVLVGVGVEAQIDHTTMNQTGIAVKNKIIEVKVVERLNRGTLRGNRHGGVTQLKNLHIHKAHSRVGVAAEKAGIKRN